MGVEVEGTGDQHVEAAINSLTRCRDDILPTDCAVFGADEDRGTTLWTVLAFDESAAGANELLTWPRRQALERNAVAPVLLLDPLRFEVVDHDGREILAGEVRIGGGTLALGRFDDIDRLLFARW